MTSHDEVGLRSFRTFALLASARLSVTLCSVASVGISTRVLQAEGMGVMNLVLSAVNLFTLVNGAVSLFFYRQLVGWDAEGRLLQNLRRYAWFLGCAGLLAISITPLLYLNDGSPWALVPPVWMGFLLAVNILVNSLAGALLHTLNTLGWRMAFAALSNLASWGGVALAWVGTSLAGAHAEIWMSGLVAAQALTLLLSSMALVKGMARRGPHMREQSATPTGPFSPVPVLRFAWPLLICTALYWAQRNSFSPWLAAEAGAATLGRFSVALSLGLLAISSFDTLFRELYGPTYYRAAAHADRGALVEAWQRYAFALFPVLAICLALIAACGNALLSLLTARPFHGLGAYVLAGALGQFWISIYSTYVILASSFMDNRVLILPNLAGAAVTAALLAWPPLADPMTAAGLAINVGLATTACTTGWRLHLRFKPALPWRSAAQACVATLPLWILFQVGDKISWPAYPLVGPLLTVALALVYALFLLHLWSRPWMGSLR